MSISVGLGRCPSSGYALSHCCLQAQEEEEEVAIMNSLLMQEGSWKCDLFPHYFPIFLAHGTAQTSLWCLEYSKTLPREEEFPCSWAPCQEGIHSAGAPWNDLCLVSPKRWVKSSVSTLKSHLLPFFPVEFYFSNGCCAMQGAVYK